MKKVGRLKKSRERWKEKASARAEEIRERRKLEKRLKTRIQELKAELKRLKNSSECQKSPPTSKNSQIIELREASDMRALCVLIVVSTMIPFRAVPKLLNILPLDGWIPHFTSVLNWTMRVGLELLNRAEEVAYPWIAIIEFQGISRITSWAAKILGIFHPDKSVEDDSLLEQLRATMPDFLSLEPFIEKFAETMQKVNSVLKLLKHQGLSEETYRSTRGLLTALPQVEVKEAIVEWLSQQIAIQRILGDGEDIPLLVSSDIIESLFGKFKYALQRCPSPEINRSTLLIPALCGHLERNSIDELLRKSQHKELLKWEEKNVPETLRQKRQKLNKNHQ